MSRGLRLAVSMGHECTPGKRGVVANRRAHVKRRAWERYVDEAGNRLVLTDEDLKVVVWMIRHGKSKPVETISRTLVVHMVKCRGIELYPVYNSKDRAVCSLRYPPGTSLHPLVRQLYQLRRS